MRQYIPNIMSCIRLMIAFCFLFTCQERITFLLGYLICGCTDVLDGYLARRWKVSSKIGALLDSLADVVVIAMMFVRIFLKLPWEIWMMAWIGLIALIRISSVLVGVFRFHTIALIHTYGNKLTGLLLFFFPICYLRMNFTIVVIVLCFVASIAALDELIVMIASQTLDRDTKGSWNLQKGT